MRGKKKMLASVFARSGVLKASRMLASGASSRLVVLAYHRVLPAIDASFSGDEELVSALRDEFEWQVNFLAANTTPLSIERLLAVLRGDSELPPRATLITFDDGCVDAVEHAVPVLRAAGVPATFFVSTGYMGTRRLYWFDEVVHLFSHCSRSTVSLETLGLELSLPQDRPGRKRAAATVVRSLKLATERVRVEALAELRAACGGCLPEEVIESNRPMDWSELRALADQGMDIGSHSVTHPVLSTLDDSELEFELEESRRRIESELSVVCRTLAYPLGGDRGYSVSGAIAVDERVRRATDAAGYLAAFTYIPGTVRVGRDDPLQMRRVPVERYLTRDEFAARLFLPDLFV
ncbi:MAG TPA: polysaccharide deacetylase family protein [Steroidobacteraceae bacterium]|nr:polysaccharide deacetylase family protein [Steroidobacteraceae bacterium]